MRKQLFNTADLAGRTVENAKLHCDELYLTFDDNSFIGFQIYKEDMVLRGLGPKLLAIDPLNLANSIPDMLLVTLDIVTSEERESSIEGITMPFLEAQRLKRHDQYLRLKKEFDGE